MSISRANPSQAVCQSCSKTFKPLKYQSKAMFCTRQCASAYTKRVKTRIRFEAGEVTERATAKYYVAERDGYACAECKISDYMGKPISLHLDHIDGNAGNNMPSNFRLLCPNCHSQTPFFGGRNKGSGRKALGLPLR